MKKFSSSWLHLFFLRLCYLLWNFYFPSYTAVTELYIYDYSFHGNLWTIYSNFLAACCIYFIHTHSWSSYLLLTCESFKRRLNLNFCYLSESNPSMIITFTNLFWLLYFGFDTYFFVFSASRRLPCHNRRRQGILTGLNLVTKYMARVLCFVLISLSHVSWEFNVK